MDIEKLASLLLKEPAIWCAKDPRHHDRNYVATAWRNIASELETTVELVQKKYKSLRDQFRKELKTAPAGKSGDPGLAREEYTSRWKYFNLFFFLRDDMIGRKSSGNTTAAAAALQGVPQETQESTDSASTDNTPLLSPLSPEAGPSSVIPCPSPSPSISTPSSQTPSFRDQESQQKLGGMAKKKRVTALNKDPGQTPLLKAPTPGKTLPHISHTPLLKATTPGKTPPHISQTPLLKATTPGKTPPHISQTPLLKAPTPGKTLPHISQTPLLKAPTPGKTLPHISQTPLLQVPITN
ncbi:hypothetical protein O3P69_011814 [Scylla paramamosain]|uniref:MADF domain-containing protein n=1 Tax=Scylla paramamosain TaxID=85552 RepID=A0AAW0SC89_SCYPA